MAHRFLRLTFLLLAAGVSSGAPLLGQTDPDSSEFRWIALPYLGYAPETELSFGVSGIAYFHVGAVAGLRPSNVSGGVQYTTRNQFSIVSNADIYPGSTDYRVTGRVSWERWPYFFWGTGNRTLESDREAYTPHTTRFDAALYRVLIGSGIQGGLNVGLRYSFRQDRISSVEAGGMLETGLVPGGEGGTLSGIQLLVNYDSRDNVFSAHHGEYGELRLGTFPGFLGSTLEHTRIDLDLRMYRPVPLGAHHTLALQALASTVAGTAPFFAAPTFGGDAVMRGYYPGKYLDKSSLIFQSEYRFPVVWRIGATLFAGVAQVSRGLAAIRIDDFHAGYGGGVTFLVDPVERLVARVDLGTGDGALQFYVAFSRAI